MTNVMAATAAPGRVPYLTGANAVVADIRKRTARIVARPRERICTKDRKNGEC
jgi:hypothetical protein